MHKLQLILIVFAATACNPSDLKKENEELLILTKELTNQVYEFQQQAESAAAEARMAQAEAEQMAQLAHKQAMEARDEVDRLLTQLENCK